MKYLIIILLLVSSTAFGQTKYYIRADSTQLEKIGGNNELILKNGTRTRTGGYLKNTFDGRTGFFYAIDSAYISGGNLVLVRGGGTQDVTVVLPGSTTPGLQDVITQDPVLTAGDNTISNTADDVLRIQKNISTNVQATGLWAEVNITGTSTANPSVIDADLNINGSGVVGGGQSDGVNANLTLGATGKIGVYSGFRTTVSTTAGADINIYESFSSDGFTNSATIGDYFAYFWGGISNDGSGTIDNLYGLFLDTVNTTGVNNYYAIYTKNGSVRLGALPTGASTDSIMTWEAATGIVRKRNVASIISSGTIPISSLTASAATNGLTIGHAQTWTSSLTTATPLTLTTSTITSGNILSLVSTSTAGVTGETGLNVSLSGTLASSEATKGINVTNAHVSAGVGTNFGVYTAASGSTFNLGLYGVTTGAATENTGIEGEASGATTNYGVVGISGGAATTNYGGRFVATGATTNYGSYSSVTGAATTNIAGYFNATGATTNNAINIAAGALTLNGSAGTSGQVLTSAGANTLPTWSTPSAGGGSPAGNFGNLQINRNGAFATPGSDSLDFESATGLTVKGNITSSTLTANRVVYAGTAGLLSTSANLTYDNANMVITAAGGVGTGLTITSTNAASYASANFITPTGGNGFQIGKYGASGTVPNGVFFYNPDNSPITFTTNNNRIMDVTGAGNLLLGGTTDPASAYYTIGLFNGGAPTGSITNGVIIYSEDVAASAELKVRDEAGNITVLSPHHFEGIPMGKSEDMAWSYYSERDGKYITVDMLKAIRTIEDLTRRVEKLEKELNMKSKKPVKLVYTGKVKAKKPVPINKQP